MAYQIQLRRDTAADWTTNDTTLSDGELGYETDTRLFKIGDGVTAWTSLAYITMLPLFSQAAAPSPNPGVACIWYEPATGGTAGKWHLNVQQTNASWEFLELVEGRTS